MAGVLHPDRPQSPHIRAVAFSVRALALYSMAGYFHAELGCQSKASCSLASFEKRCEEKPDGAADTASSRPVNT